MLNEKLLVKFSELRRISSFNSTREDLFLALYAHVGTILTNIACALLWNVFKLSRSETGSQRGVTFG